jgi:hypothetical protein
MFRVEMKFDGDANWYPYGTYETRDRANEVAMIVREERGCEVWIEEV